MSGNVLPRAKPEKYMKPEVGTIPRMEQRPYPPAASAQLICITLSTLGTPALTCNQHTIQRAHALSLWYKFTCVILYCELHYQCGVKFLWCSWTCLDPRKFNPAKFYLMVWLYLRPCANFNPAKIHFDLICKNITPRKVPVI